MKERIIEIIENLTGITNLKDNIDIDLIENEILDSFAFIELIATLEEEFEIEIQPTQIEPITWRKVENIYKLVKELQK